MPIPFCSGGEPDSFRRSGDTLLRLALSSRTSRSPTATFPHLFPASHTSCSLFLEHRRQLPAVAPSRWLFPLTGSSSHGHPHSQFHISYSAVTFSGKSEVHPVVSNWILPRLPLLPPSCHLPPFLSFSLSLLPFPPLLSFPRSPCCLLIHYVTENDLELLIPLPPSPKFWNFSTITPSLCSAEGGTQGPHAC